MKCPANTKKKTATHYFHFTCIDILTEYTANIFLIDIKCVCIQKLAEVPLKPTDFMMTETPNN